MRKRFQAMSLRSFGAVLAVVGFGVGFADPSPEDTPPFSAPADFLNDTAWQKHLAEIAASIKPNPPFEIPDNPPPHEGAMIELSPHHRASRPDSG